MHVLIIPSWYPADGQDLNGIFFREQARSLAQAGHKVGVIAPMFRSLRDGRAAFRPAFDTPVWHDDGPITVLRAHGTFTSTRVPHFDLWRWCRAGEKLFADYVRDHGRPDVIHAHSLLLGGVLAARLSRRHGIAFGVTEHSSTFARGLVQDWQVPGLRDAADQAAFRLAVSQALINAVQTRIGPADWTVAPNSLTPVFEADFTPAKAPSGAGLRLISVGNLNQNKGFDLLLRAVAAARASGAAVALDIGGSGPARADLEALCAQLGIQDHVRFLGGLSRAAVRTALRGADAFALASRHETFGIVFIEAMSQGLPVIATQSGGPEGIVTPQDGILVPTDDVQALADAIGAMARDAAHYDGPDIRRRTLQRFSQSALVSQLEAVYARAVQQAGPA